VSNIKQFENRLGQIWHFVDTIEMIIDKIEDFGIVWQTTILWSNQDLFEVGLLRRISERTLQFELRKSKPRFYTWERIL
jgi:hypothetical protein